MALFIGEFEHMIDQKSRIIVPSQWRESMDPEDDGIGFFLTPGYDQCLFVYTKKAWKKEEEKAMVMPYTVPETRQFRRLFFARARYGEADSQGRLLIDMKLRNAAGLKKKIALVGGLQMFEIWDLERWRKYEEAGEEIFDSVAEKAEREMRRELQ